MAVNRGTAVIELPQPVSPPRDAKEGNALRLSDTSKKDIGHVRLLEGSGVYVQCGGMVRDRAGTENVDELRRFERGSEMKEGPAAEIITEGICQGDPVHADHCSITKKVSR